MRCKTRVRLDLNSARAAYNDHIGHISSTLAVASLDETLKSLMKKGATAGLSSSAEDISRKNTAGQASSGTRISQNQLFQRAVNPWLDRLRKAASIDVVALLDSRGNVIHRANNPDRQGDPLADNPLVAEVIERGKAASGSIVVSDAELEREGAELAVRARFDLPPTTAAKPTSDKQRSDGMLAAAAVPLFDENGKLLGILYGGDLLNRRSELVDTIKREVFSNETYEGKEIGTVTIFQGDLRIATNVVDEDGSRAVGTRMSETVYDEVIGRGGVWAKPAFVVNDWYITAYEPIRDPAGQIIGAIYVGLLQAPFDREQTAVTVRFLLLLIAATATSLLLIYLMTMVIMRPVGKIVDMSRKVVAGDMSARVGIRPPGEIGSLCRAVDYMADAVVEREERIKAALRNQVTRAEQLASIGRLAAGVAHEINNPLTAVLTFAHLLHDKPHVTDEDREDLDLIIHETTRAADIVRGLLDFARERPVLMEPLDLNDVVRRTVRLIANQKKFEHVAIGEHLQNDLPEINGDMNQLQQVLLNLSLNACTAMPDGGRLDITTAATDGKVVLKVADTGCGIKPEHLEQIFEPFFTTQDVGKGTGLGLSVSHGIVEQHGGEMEVRSQEGQGTTFTIILPVMT